MIFDQDREKKIYLAVIRLSAENSNRTHVLEVAPLIKQIIEKNSNKECKLAFTDSDGYGFSYFLKTTSEAGYLRNLLCEKDNNGKGCALRSGDSLLILEIGDEFAGTGFSNAWTWLQHHM